MRKLLKLGSDASTRDNIPKKELKIRNLNLLLNGVEVTAPELLSELKLCLIKVQSLINISQRIKLSNFYQLCRHTLHY